MIPLGVAMIHIVNLQRHIFCLIRAASPHMYRNGQSTLIEDLLQQNMILGQQVPITLSQHQA